MKGYCTSIAFEADAEDILKLCFVATFAVFQHIVSIENKTSRIITFDDIYPHLEQDPRSSFRVHGAQVSKHGDIPLWTCSL
jgi:hypothetical protein